MFVQTEESSPRHCVTHLTSTTNGYKRDAKTGLGNFLFYFYTNYCITFILDLTCELKPGKWLRQQERDQMMPDESSP
jgi:hypothetical protein